VIRHIEHVAVVVADATSAVDWYLHFGFVVDHDELLPDAGVRVVHLLPRGADPDNGATAIQLVQPIGPCPVADFMREHGEGLHHLCFAVEDVTAAAAHAGEPAPEIARGGRGRRACFLQQRPNDALIELTEIQPHYLFLAAAGPDGADKK
jgi:catechol 2,3-dioxygenase-like lactoylglutathione lyase family enzyme